MSKPDFRFYCQEWEESQLHTRILRSMDHLSADDLFEASFTSRILDVYFDLLLRHNLRAAAEMFEALERIGNERQAARAAAAKPAAGERIENGSLPPQTDEVPLTKAAEPVANSYLPSDRDESTSVRTSHPTG